MAMMLYDKAALMTAVRTAARPVAFLVGAPMSTDSGGGVPGVAQMLDLAREEIQQRAPAELHRFEDAIRGKAPGDAYQAAMSWLQGNLTQDGVNRVVEAAVLRARRAGAPTEFDGEGNASDWYVPAGTQALASLVCRDRDRFIGPILTTNFDPLLSIAIEACGGRARMRVIQSDGSLSHDVRRAGEIEVVHLHGFWRGSDTLHTPGQLTAARPRLKDSLKGILCQRTLVVAAYGGWDDVFASALSEVALDDAAQVNVLWCFRDVDAGKVAYDYAELFQRVQASVTRGRFVAYGGIDCHSVFADIAATLSPATVVASAATAVSSPHVIAGWQRVDAAYLGELSALTHNDTLRFFDGAVPTWRHAISNAIPRRKAVAVIGARLAATRNAGASSSMQLIRAAGGEGKSTILLQAGADAARSGGLAVLWRLSAKEGLPPGQVARLDPSLEWLIAADDADTLVDDLSETLQRLNAEGRSNIHFLLATRDADWRAARGDAKPWEEWTTRHPDLVLRGVDPDDAVAVVRAWEECGPDALRELAARHDTADRAAALERAVRDAEGQQVQQSRLRRIVDGSFFGGLLTVRFGQAGLQAHVRAFITRLRDMPVEQGNGSLSDALLYIAACHGTGLPGIDQRVLADLLDVPRDWVHRRVVLPLGEEATAVHSHGHVLTRHSMVAAAILAEAESSAATDLTEVWSSMVHQAVSTGRDIRMDPQWYSRLIHAGPWLQRSLPQQLPEERRKAIAISAVRATTTALPERLDCLVDVGRTYRAAQDLEEACRTFRENLKGASTKVDYAASIRGYWYEWSVCEGERGEGREHAVANAWLGGVSLSDHLNPHPITEEQGKLSCAGLGVAFGRLATRDSACSYAKARRAAAHLGRLTNPDRKTAGYYDRYDREADKLHTPYPRDVAEAIVWLSSGVNQAGDDLQDDFLAGLVPKSGVNFTHLHTMLGAKQKR